MITRIEASNVFCFSTFEMDVPADGTIIEGANAKGKTSVLNLIRVALVEKGATKDMIKRGADKGEILVRVDGHLVKRVMHGGDKYRTTLRVTDPDGRVVPEPATFLKNLLGLSPLDPIELFLEKDKGKRRAKILSAIPCVVTAEQLVQWCPPGADIVELVGDDGSGSPALDEHGLEIIERARKVLYTRRTEANRLVKERQSAADQAAAKAGAVRDALSAYHMQHGLSAETVDLAKAQGDLDAARAAEMLLVQQRQAAERSALAQTKTREKITMLRQKAKDARVNKPIPPTDEDFARAAKVLDGYENDFAKADSEVRRLEHELRIAMEARKFAADMVSAAKAHEQTLRDGVVRAAKAVDDIADLEGQAQELEQALGVLPIAPSDAQFVEAERRTKQATALVVYAKKASEVATWAEVQAKAQTLLQGAQADAAALDRSVKALADDAPAALLAAADGIRGLSIDGDEVLLDGVALDQLSGQERLFFAVEVARRLNAKSKLLCVDGLEVLDAEHRRMFIERATKDGYQLIATRVADDGGDPVAKPIR